MASVKENLVVLDDYNEYPIRLLDSPIIKLVVVVIVQVARQLGLRHGVETRFSSLTTVHLRFCFFPGMLDNSKLS